MTDLLNPTEVEAAELEGLLPVDADHELQGKILLARALKQRRDLATAEYNAAKDELGAALAAANLQGFTLEGKVVVRRSFVRTPRFDSKGFKEKHPKLYAAFVNVTESIRITID